MKRLNKILTVLFVALFAVSSFLLIQSSSASQPAVTEFTLKYVDHSYDVAPQQTSTKDPYTGEVTTSTIPGYHVDSKFVDATIKNPPGATYYNFRWKGYYEDEWKYFPFSPPSNNFPYFLGDWFSVPYEASNSSYTVASLYFLPEQITPGGQIEVQVQALYGGFRAEPYGHAIDVGGPTYDFYFEGETSDWSASQIFTMLISTSPTQNPTSSPSVPEFPAYVILPFLFGIALTAVFLTRKRILLNN